MHHERESGRSLKSEDELWNEIVNSLASGSELYKAAFTQLQDSMDPFETAMSVVAALPPGLRQESQLVIRTWATREAARRGNQTQQTAEITQRGGINFHADVSKRVVDVQKCGQTTTEPVWSSSSHSSKLNDHSYYSNQCNQSEISHHFEIKKDSMNQCGNNIRQPTMSKSILNKPVGEEYDISNLPIHAIVSKYGERRNDNFKPNLQQDPLRHDQFGILNTDMRLHEQREHNSRGDDDMNYAYSHSKRPHRYSTGSERVFPRAFPHIVHTAFETGYDSCTIVRERARTTSDADQRSLVSHERVPSRWSNEINLESVDSRPRYQRDQAFIIDEDQHWRTTRKYRKLSCEERQPIEHSIRKRSVYRDEGKGHSQWDIMTRTASSSSEDGIRLRQGAKTMTLDASETHNDSDNSNSILGHATRPCTKKRRSVQERENNCGDSGDKGGQHPKSASNEQSAKKPDKLAKNKSRRVSSDNTTGCMRNKRGNNVRKNCGCSSNGECICARHWAPHRHEIVHSNGFSFEPGGGMGIVKTEPRSAVKLESRINEGSIIEVKIEGWDAGGNVMQKYCGAANEAEKRVRDRNNAGADRQSEVDATTQTFERASKQSCKERDSRTKQTIPPVKRKPMVVSQSLLSVPSSSSPLQVNVDRRKDSETVRIISCSPHHKTKSKVDVAGSEAARSAKSSGDEPEHNERNTDNEAQGKANCRVANRPLPGKDTCMHSSGCRRQAGTKGMCQAHGGARKCRHASGCATTASAGGLCTLHGGGRKCKFDGCLSNAQRMGLCRVHGGNTKCRHASGCTTQIQSKGLCKAHGGGSKCQFDSGCERHAVKKGLCCAHGGGTRCNFAGGCEKKIQRKGLCRLHGGTKKCEFRGCTKHADRKRLCFEHGRVHKCTHDGCERRARSKRLCAAHVRGRN